MDGVGIAGVFWLQQSQQQIKRIVNSILTNLTTAGFTKDSAVVFQRVGF
jgi:hypothetical protein